MSTRKDRGGAVEVAIVATAAVLLWIFTALSFAAGAEFLSSLAGVLIGATALVSAGIMWSYRRITIRSAAAVCALGVLLAASASLSLIYGPSEPPIGLEVGLGILMLSALWYWRRQMGQNAR